MQTLFEREMPDFDDPKNALELDELIEDMAGRSTA